MFFSYFRRKIRRDSEKIVGLNYEYRGVKLKSRGGKGFNNQFWSLLEETFVLNHVQSSVKHTHTSSLIARGWNFAVA